MTEIYVWPMGIVTLYIIQIGDTEYALTIAVYPDGQIRLKVM
jgi:hypothetical protein